MKRVYRIILPDGWEASGALLETWEIVLDWVRAHLEDLEPGDSIEIEAVEMTDEAWAAYMALPEV